MLFKKSIYSLKHLHNVAITDLMIIWLKLAFKRNLYFHAKSYEGRVDVLLYVLHENNIVSWKAPSTYCSLIYCIQ